MSKYLAELYGLNGSDETMKAFKEKVKQELASSDPFETLFLRVLNICENAYESISELNTDVSEIISDLYEYNETLRFDNPVKNHIPVMIALLKSITCYEIGKIATDVQNNHKASTQLYGLALDHLLQGDYILKTLEIDSLLFKNLRSEYVEKFMNSYSDNAGLENMHSAITLKHYLLDAEQSNYAGELYSSMGHGFYNLYSNIIDLSPESDWMPFTYNYIAEKCVETHKKAYEMLMDNADPDKITLSKYYIQSMRIHIDTLFEIQKKSFKIFLDYGLYELAYNTSKQLSHQYEMFDNEVKTLGGPKLLEEHIEDFQSIYRTLYELNDRNQDKARSYFEILRKALERDFTNMVNSKGATNLPQVFSEAFLDIPEELSDDVKYSFIKTLIYSSSAIYSMDQKKYLLNTLNGLESYKDVKEAKEYYKQLEENADKLKEFGVTVLEVKEGEKPDIDDFDEVAQKHVLLLKDIIGDKVVHFQFLAEFSKALGIEYSRKDLVAYRSIRSIISVKRKMQYIDSFFDDVEDDKPVTMTLRFKSMETISKALYQLSEYKNENDTIVKLTKYLKNLMDTMLVLCTRDEANIYEYSESVRVFIALIKEVLSDSTNKKAKHISEYTAYSFFDRKFGLENFLEKASYLREAAIIHRHAFDMLTKNENFSMAKQAFEASKRSEAEYYFLCALFYESQKGGNPKADEFYSRAIESYSEAGIEVGVEGLTARKFWLREQQPTHFEF